MNSKKGTKWALSCVATSAAVLSFLVVSNNVLADSADTTQTDGTSQVAQSSNSAQAVTSATQNYSGTYQKMYEQNNQTAQAVPSSNNNQNTTAENNTNPVSQAAVTNASTSRPITRATNNPDVKDGGTFANDIANYSSSNNTGYDLHPENNELGYAAYFHIFANEAHLNAHTNGNVAVGTLNGGVNFGTNIKEELVDYDVSYIQNILNIASSSFVSGGDTRTNKVVFGQNVDVDVTDTNRPTVDGTNIDHLLASETYQDHNGNFYIDFSKLFNELDNKSTSLTQLDPSKVVGSDDYVAEINNSMFDDMNNRVIDLSDYQPNDDNQIVIYLSPEVLQQAQPLTIKGISKDGDGTNVVINVDTHGKNPYYMTSPIKIIYSDGSDRNSQETEYFGDNHLLWNFYDSTASDNLYKGEIKINGVFQGSLLAPEATVTVNQNLDGNIVADKVNVNAETHRWDLQDNNDKDTDYEYEIAVPIPGEVPGLPIIDFPDPGDTDGWELPTPPDEPGNEDNGDGNETDTDDNDNGDGNETDTDDNDNGNEIDTDGDGIPDTPGVDTDGDGIPDTPGVDTDGDGIPDTPGIDTNGDGIPDKPVTLPGTELPTKDVNNATSNKKTFPQTGAKSSAWLSALGLALLSFLGIKKRKED